MSDRPDCTNAWNAARGVNLFTWQLDSDRVPQKLHSALFDPAQGVQRFGHPILLFNDPLAKCLAFLVPTGGNARKLRLGQVNPHQHEVRFPERPVR